MNNLKDQNLNDQFLHPRQYRDHVSYLENPLLTYFNAIFTFPQNYFPTTGWANSGNCGRYLLCKRTQGRAGGERETLFVFEFIFVFVNVFVLYLLFQLCLYFPHSVSKICNCMCCVFELSFVFVFPPFHCVSEPMGELEEMVLTPPGCPSQPSIVPTTINKVPVPTTHKGRHCW